MFLTMKYNESTRPSSVSELRADPTEVAVANRDVAPSILGPDLKIIGNLTSAGDLRVNGTIEGDIKCRLLTVGPAAQVTGALQADTVRTYGTVTGPIEARAVVLERNARVDGDIVHESLTIEACAHFDGRVRTRNGVAKSNPDDRVAGLEPGEEGAPNGKGEDENLDMTA